MQVKFYLYKCVCLREYWPVVDQEDTVLSGVTLNWIVPRSLFRRQKISATASL